jgi:putative endonuclease
MMVEVYATQSEVNGDIYVGMALNAAKRLRQHNSGQSRDTKGLTPWRIIHTESFPDWATARVRENYLKSGVGKEFLKALQLKDPSD